MLVISTVEAFRKIIFWPHTHGERIHFTTQAVTMQLALLLRHQLE